MNKVVTASTVVATIFVIIGMTENAYSGARTYDLNLLLDEPYPYWANSYIQSSGAQLPSAGQAENYRQASAESQVSRSHDYTLSIRFLPWLAQPSGDVRLEQSGGGSTDIDLHDDLGLDDFEFNLAGSANLRLGRHDFWFDALAIDMSASDTVERTITFGSITIPISVPVRSEIDVAVYDIRYGYSFFDLESDGFRLGPTLGVAYLDLEVKITNQTTGADASIEEKLPMPRIGMKGEIPYGNFLFDASLAGIFINYEDFEGYAVEGNFSVAWRPYRNLGLVGGYRVITADVDYKNDNFDITFHGPYLGVEFRY